MSSIGKGDWVQCIELRECSCGCAHVPPISVGSVYVVESVCTDIPHSPGVLLQGVVMPRPHHCFPLKWFKPLGGSAVQRQAPPVSAPRTLEDA